MTGAVMGRGDKKGLVNNHAFTVLGVAEYKGTKLVKIRNPWGSERYHGTWSDKDTKNWTEDAKKALNHQANMGDGVFFMSISDYKSLFYNTIVGFYGGHISHASAKWDRKTDIKKAILFKIVNPVEQMVHIGMQGPMSRNFVPRWGTCKSDLSIESFWFMVRGNNGGPLVKDDNKRWAMWSTSNEYFSYAKLPKGTYEVEGGSDYSKGKRKGTGDMPYSIVAHGSAQPLEVYQFTKDK